MSGLTIDRVKAFNSGYEVGCIETTKKLTSTMYTREEVIFALRALHLDSLEGQYSKEKLDWCNKWIEENLYK